MIALREVLKAPPKLVFRLCIEAEHLSTGGSMPPRTVIHELDLRAGRRYRFVHHAPDGQQFASRRPPLECRTGRLVLEAKEVLLWSVLEKAGAPVAVRGFGMLFDDRQPDGNKTEER